MIAPTPLTFAALLGCALGALACSSSNGSGDGAPAAGTGGGVVAGGSANAGGGATSAAGAAGTAGPSPAGTGGAAGAAGAAGTAGAAGAAGTAGAAGAAGSAGTAGAAGSAGGPSEAQACVAQGEGCVWLCEGGLCQCDCPPPAPSCFVVSDLTQCCRNYRVASTQEIQADECLLPYPGVTNDSALVGRCVARAPIDCGSVQCGLPMPAPSRVAVEDGMGGCQFGDECQDGNDCLLAVDKSACCACPTSTPLSLVQADACLTYADDASQPAGCAPCVSGMPCGACPEATPPTCLVSDEAFNVCR